ncbi:methylamine dehydrogenase accessory protein MauD [Dechloromonas sp. ZS-1]|uniref:methylamine dehydrogenase accessory protein MauD n=1 Tax=Dechloromonas sp. ZS-1 TaxID=3138067 RepID=UPI0031FBB936
MQDALFISSAMLWLVVLALVVVVLALARQIGILYERIAPMGALMMDQGPKVGELAPRFELDSLNGRRMVVGGARGRSQLLFFLSPTCPVCKKLLPVLKSIQRDEAAWLDVSLASDGELPTHSEFYQKAALQSFDYALSTDLGMTYRIAKLPYAVLIGEDGLIRGKGLVNSREQLESLFAAKEAGVASIQEYVDQRA